MTHARRIPLPDPAALAALAAQLRLWLLGLLHWLIDTLGGEARLPAALKRELRAELDDARTEVLDLIGMLAYRRLRPCRRTYRGGANNTHADPHRSDIKARRALSRGLIARGGSLRARVARLLDALAHLDAQVLRLLRRIARHAKGAWIVEAIDDGFADGESREPRACDTS